MCLLQGLTVSLLLNATNILLCSNETLLDSTGILCGDNMWKDANALAIKFSGRNYTLNFTIEFVNKISVHLIGSKWTTILCDSSEKNGISFKDTTNVFLHNIVMKECGFIFKSIKDSIQTYTGIGIINASRVLIENLTLSHSSGTGCSIVNLTDCVSIINSTFEEGFGGLYISTNVSTLEKSSKTQIIITKSIFKNNNGNYYSGGVQLSIGTPNTSILVTNCIFKNNHGIYGGGGLRVQSSRGSHMTLINCIFDGNKANYGGGLDIYVERFPIILCIESCQFTANEATYYGGGIAMHTLKSCHNNNSNMAYFVNTHFYNNTAKFSGGGLHLHMPVLFDATCNYFTHIGDAYTFKNCEMKDNNARIGAAIILIFALFSEYKSTCTLENCSFVNNYIKNTNPGTARTASNDLVCSGSVIFKNFTLLIKNHTFFTNNSGTALCLESSKMVVENDTTVVFSGNHGDYGGAFALHRLSTIELHSGVHLNFSNNSANLMGGAIFIAENKYNSYTECFIIVHSYSNATLIFDANNISSNIVECHTFGNSIYIYSINACKGVTNFINATEHIMFDFGKESSSCEISTRATLNKSDTNEPLKFIPGKGRYLPINLTNDFDQNIKKFIEIQVNSSNDIKLNSSPIIAPQKQIALYGEPKATGIIILTMRVTSCTDDNDKIQFSMELQQCPPGLIIVNASCHCEIHSNYVGLSKCDNEGFQAHIAHAYWMGYLVENNSSDSNLYSSLCPTGFCHRMSNQNVSIPLPKAPIIEEIDNLICGPNRTGFLCAKCRANHSAFFHTESFNCFQDQHCSFGCLFFLLSEILPVTIVFVLVIFFNIQLTSGNVQGFILYAQIFHSLHITANDNNNNTMSALRYLQMIYRMLNLEFFTHDKLSFCLLKGATSLNIIAVKYITIAYSLLLILVVVFLWNKCCTRVRVCGHRTSKIAAVHGLSSFLVLCYSQCTKVSLLLLTPATVFQKSSKYYKQVVFYDGQMDFFEGKHLAYAIPVIMLAFPLVVIPPFLLFAYPLCYKVFALLHIQESMFLKIVCKIIPLERFRPFFDSFQSSFKDEYRCFAGLYFIYRFLTLLSFAGVHSLTTFYTVVQIQLILMLLLHTWIQPYKKKWHNQLDSYILCTLAMLNSITVFHLYKSFKLEEPNEKTFYFTIIQIGLAYSPILVMLAQYAYSKRSPLKKFWQKLPMNTNVLVLGRKCDNEEMLLSLQESRDMDLSTSYNKE